MAIVMQILSHTPRGRTRVGSVTGVWRVGPNPRADEWPAVPDGGGRLRPSEPITSPRQVFLIVHGIPGRRVRRLLHLQRAVKPDPSLLVSVDGLPFSEREEDRVADRKAFIRLANLPATVRDDLQTQKWSNIAWADLRPHMRIIGLSGQDRAATDTDVE